MPVSVKKYELTFILGESATPESAKAKSEELGASIKALGGSVTKEEHWGRRDLAYVIARSRSGIYTTLWFDLPSDKLKELDRQLRFDEQVIRSLVTLAYTDEVQAGSLYPVPEEDKKPRRGDREEAPAGAEEQLRRGGTARSTEKTENVEDAEQLSEADRLAQLDSRLDSLLGDEESAK